MKTSIRLLAILFLLMVSLTIEGKSAERADKKLRVFSMITGFHSVVNQEESLEYRILEVDESSSVALNPISLFLVITNTLSGEELIEDVFKLPNVSELKRVGFEQNNNQLKLEVNRDKISDDGRVASEYISGLILISIKTGEQLEVSYYELLADED